MISNCIPGTETRQIGMEFGTKTCGILIMNRGEMVKSEGIRLSDGDVMREVGQEVHIFRYREIG